MSKHSFSAYILTILSILSFNWAFSEEIDHNSSLIDSIASKYTTSTYGPEKVTPIDDTNPNGFSETLQKEFAAKELFLSDNEVQKTAFQLACDKREFKTNLNADMIDSSFIDKLEIVGNGKTKSTHLVGRMVQDHTHTAIGKALTALTVCHPTTDTEILRNRQQIISTLSQDEQLCAELDLSLGRIGQAEKKSLIFWQSKPLVNEKLWLLLGLVQSINILN